MNLILQRVSQTIACTMGKLTLPDVTLDTLELPWVPDPGYPGGKPDVSCVPDGIYDLVLHDTAKHPKSFALVNRELGVLHEPDPALPTARVACLVHVANKVSDLEGCIGVGTVVDGPCMIGNSRIAYDEFVGTVPWVIGHTLTILGPPGDSNG